MKTLLEVGYQFIVIPQGCVAVIAESLSEWELVERKYIDGKYLYSPKDKIEISIFAVRDDDVRSPTPEEKENQKIKDLEQRLGWKEGDIKKKNKRIEELECKLKIFELEKSDDTEKED